MVRRWEWYALALVLVALNLFMFRWALKGTVQFQKDVLVPDVTGKSLLEALSVLSDQDLTMKREGSEFNDTVPAGTILRQQPASGTTVRGGKIIRVTISQGGETVYVPELAGQSLRSAEVTLRTGLLSLGEVRFQPSLKYEKDIVISQNPEPKKILSKNSLVHLVVSEGPPADGRILMPDFTGKNWNDVQTWATQTGIKVEMTEDATSQESETVLQQNLPADSPVSAETTVRFVVASRKSGAAAGAQKARFHFEVPQGESGKQYSFVLLDSSSPREIWRGNPEPGSKLDIPIPAKTNPNARIRIFVNGILTEERSLQ